MGKVFDDPTKRDIIACYEARKYISNESNDGIHALYVTEERDEHGFPTCLMGHFADTVKITQDHRKNFSIICQMVTQQIS